MFNAAFQSRSRNAPQFGHSHSRTLSGFGPSLRPHCEQTWLLGHHRSTWMALRPHWAQSTSTLSVNVDHAASATLLPIRVRMSPLTHNVSMATAWFSPATLEANWYARSLRCAPIRAYSLALASLVFE